MNSDNVIAKQSYDEITLKELFQRVREWITFLKTKWVAIILAGVFGGLIGLGYAWTQKVKYTAILTFVIEEDKSGGSGLAGAIGLASSLGIDMGGGGGSAFSSANLIELMKSRSLVQKALLQPVDTKRNKQQSLADYYIEFSGLKKAWEIKPRLSELVFPPLSDPNSFTITQDSVMGILWKQITRPGGVLSVSQKDKKVSIITIESTSENERFAKFFTENIAQVVSDFYVETKSKKARQNLEILQRQTDSVRNELNGAIADVATANDNTYNLNPALNIRRIPSTQRQIDVQTATAVLTQLIPNLEMAKVSLQKETPLIQVIDKPVFPLVKNRTSNIRTMILGGLLSGFLTIIVLIFREFLKNLLQNEE